MALVPFIESSRQMPSPYAITARPSGYASVEPQSTRNELTANNTALATQRSQQDVTFSLVPHRRQVLLKAQNHLVGYLNSEMRGSNEPSPRGSVANSQAERKYLLRITSNRSDQVTKVNKYRHSSLTDRLGTNYVDKVRKMIQETDLVEELAKKQKVGWASISQLSLLHQKQQLARRAIGKSETR